MKFILDKALSAFGIAVFLPIFLITPLLIFLYDFKNPLYTPDRVGKNFQKFKMIKFRSMIINADKNKVDSTKSDDSRITPIGKFIRKFKLDEFSQLLNVFIGNMSLVGPRPNVEREVNMYSDEENIILSIKPGITDFSSIVFSDEADILEGSEDPDLKYNQLIRPWKSRLAILYVKNNNVFIDVFLLFLTISSFFNRNYTLKLLSTLVYKLSEDKTLAEICLRINPLEPAPPPGFSSIIQSRY